MRGHVLCRVLVVSSLCLTLEAWAAIPVEDIPAAAQRVIMLGNQALQYARQGQQIINEYNQIRNQLIQIEHMVTNLKRLPPGLNFFDQMSAYSSAVDGIMSRATSLSFVLDKAVSDFADLYEDAALKVATADLLATRRKMAKASMQTSKIAVQTQAIKNNLTDVYDKIKRLLDGSYTAPGALWAAQVQSQQAALLHHTEQQMQAMAATNARLIAMDAARKAALEQVALQDYERAMTLAPVGRWQAGPVVDFTLPPERIRRAGN